jgi:tetratricopeptide (TPR) repeat protein
VAEPTPVEDLQLALHALDEGDSAHAAQHLAGVLGEAPLQDGLDGATVRWLGSVPDPLALVPIPRDGAYRGLVALRAFALEHTGRRGEACLLLLNVQASSPHLPYAERIVGWIVSGDLDDAEVAHLAAPLNKCSDHPHLAKALLPALRHLMRRDPLHEAIAFSAVRAARNAGQTAEAVVLATDAYRRGPSWMTASARGMALAANADVAAAIEAYRDALRHDPSDTTAWLDIGDLCILAQPERACEAYDAVLAREPEHPWALPSRLYLRWRNDGDASARERILVLAKQDGDNDRARLLARQVDRYEHRLVHPGSAIVNTLAGTKEKGVRLGKIGVSSLEAPSTLLVVEEVGKQLGMAIAPKIEFNEIPQPDPRLPRGPVAFDVWTYRAGGLRGAVSGLRQTAVPALGVPRQEVASAVADLASQPYSLSAWTERARTIGRALGPSAAVDLLATTVHPPPARDGADTAAWIFGVQVAAALCLGGVDRGWAGSMRERSLLSLWLGPIDWTTTAALIALTEIAVIEPEVASEIIPVITRELDGPINPIRWSCIVEPMLWLLDRAPIEHATRMRLARLRRTAE